HCGEQRHDADGYVKVIPYLVTETSTATTSTSGTSSTTVSSSVTSNTISSSTTWTSSAPLSCSTSQTTSSETSSSTVTTRTASSMDVHSHFYDGPHVGTQQQRERSRDEQRNDEQYEFVCDTVEQHHAGQYDGEQRRDADGNNRVTQSHAERGALFYGQHERH
ncbi:unnamed protein product, partial [Prorocentrum cordatum]